MVIVFVLGVLNTYPLLESQNLVFRSKATAMAGSVKVIESALSGLEKLTPENVGQALTVVEETGVSRILVTDTAGRVLYDSRETGSAVGLYAFYTEIYQALQGYNAFYCSYDGDAFLSRGAAPVVYHNQTVGAIYAYEYDTEQAELFKSLQSNIARISGMVAVFVVVLSLLLSRMLTSRISELLQAIRHVREGAYSHRAEEKGSDEIAQITAEFNSLTDRLQTTENARRRFVSDASHELKTPLAGIRLLTDSILQTEHMDTETIREFVGDIGQEAERLSRITEDLLRLTRLDSGAIESAVAVEAAPVMARVERMLHMVAAEKQVELICRAEPGTDVMATEDDLHQILYNLMENGIKYSTNGGVVCTQIAVEGRAVVIRVEDNGVGIPDEDMSHIFERFYRVDKARSRAVGGTGLGLSIVRDTVLRREGTIEVAHGAQGTGTVFTVRLPLAEGGADG